VGVLVTLRLDKEEQNEGREEKQQLPGLCHALLSVQLMFLWHGTVPAMLPGSIYIRALLLVHTVECTEKGHVNT
jgi:hypothetical protein